MKVTVLGCGDAFSSGGRYHTSFLLESQEKRILVDCGATTLLRLNQLNIPAETIDTIIITHFHGDHYGGLPFLILSNRFRRPRETPFTIIGPAGVESRARALQEAMYAGTEKVIDELGIKFLEYEASQKLKHNDLVILALRVTHSEPASPHGLKVTLNDKVFAFSGDSEWDENLIKIADGADLFFIDCNNFVQDSPGHLSYQTIKKYQSYLKARKIYLTHMGPEVLKHLGELDIEPLVDGMEIIV